MALLIGGFIASILGLVGLIEWRHDFIVILKGAIPVMLLAGGVLAVYIGFDDMQEKMRDERERHAGELEKTKEEIEMVKAQTEQCREELNRLREEKSRREQ
ncbi:MAG: hypothetical protein U1C55_09025 [Smithellaceae bacterium]|nr:hypothetical protein [Smithellaceae bacterium]